VKGNVLDEKEKVEALPYPTTGDKGRRLLESFDQPRTQQLFSRLRGRLREPESHQAQGHHGDRQEEQDDPSAKR